MGLEGTVSEVEFPVSGFDVIDEGDDSLFKIGEAHIVVDTSDEDPVVLPGNLTRTGDAVVGGAASLHQWLAIFGFEEAVEIALKESERRVVSVVDDVVAEGEASPGGGGFGDARNVVPGGLFDGLWEEEEEGVVVGTVVFLPEELAGNLGIESGEGGFDAGLWVGFRESRIEDRWGSLRGLDDASADGPHDFAGLQGLLNGLIEGEVPGREFARIIDG